MGIKGCWTCRTRKLRCDNHRPACGNCTKSQRVCQGYGVQLSWPRDGDKRRSLVAHHVRRPDQFSQRYPARFINLSSWDVLIARDLEDGHGVTPCLYTLTPRPWRSLPPFHLDRKDANLLEFFNESKLRLMAPFVDESLTDFVLHVALSNASATSNIVLQALFAIAALRLQGQSQGVEYQTQVISALAKSVPQLDRASVLANLIATMLLYQYELFRPTGQLQQWNLFLCGAKQLLRGASSQILDSAESSAILDWIYFHEVSSEFSLRHWRRPKQIFAICKEGPLSRPLDPVSGGLVLSDGSNSFIDALQLVSATCRGTADYAMDAHGRQVPMDMVQIQTLENRIYESIGTEGPSFDVSGTPSDRRNMLRILYQIVSLIYLNRSVLDTSATSFQHRRLVREGMLILRRLDSCESALPLFILACEAQDDEQRLEILDILSKTSNNIKERSNHASAIQSLVEAVWNQYDLDVDGVVSYTDTLDAVISTIDTIPLFA